MIKLVDPGEAGGEMTITLNAFDLLSLMQGLERAILAAEKKIEDYNNSTDEEKASKDESAHTLFGKSFVEVIETRTNSDDRANYRELDTIHEARNAAIDKQRAEYYAAKGIKA